MIAPHTPDALWFRRHIRVEWHPDVLLQRVFSHTAGATICARHQLFLVLLPRAHDAFRPCVVGRLVYLHICASSNPFNDALRTARRTAYHPYPHRPLQQNCVLDYRCRCRPCRPT